VSGLNFDAMVSAHEKKKDFLPASFLAAGYLGMCAIYFQDLADYVERHSSSVAPSRHCSVGVRTDCMGRVGDVLSRRCAIVLLAIDLV
jgi:hypothetical protein